MIPHEPEEHLWNENILGDDTPEKLLNTLVYSLGLNLALRSGIEHWLLKPAMFRLAEPFSGNHYLEYTSKNHGGGLNKEQVSKNLL